MNEELRQNLCSGLAIEALYEKETGQGDFATCVIRGNGTVEIYPHCKVCVGVRGGICVRMWIFMKFPCG